MSPDYLTVSATRVAVLSSVLIKYRKPLTVLRPVAWRFAIVMTATIISKSLFIYYVFSLNSDNPN